MSDTTGNLQVSPGVRLAADSSYQPFRSGRDGGLVTSAIHGDQYESTSRGNVYALSVGPTTTGIAAGNLVGAAAAAAVQFALWNPVGSGVNFSLLKFIRGIVSGTPAAGAVVHAYLSVAEGDTLPTIANTVASVPKAQLVGQKAASKASFVSTAASSGTALTGATIAKVLRTAAFAGTATAEAVIGPINGVEQISGDIVLAPGSLWLPQEPGAGTTMLLNYTIVWEEIPV